MINPDPKKENEPLAQSFDQAVDHLGGFGKCHLFNNLLGLFHAYCIIFIIISMITNGYLFYALPFLELYQEYDCPSEVPDCTHQDRCLNREGIKINWDSHKSLDNWVERFNLECKLLKCFELIGESPILIGMIGSA